jgi:hypothetical protein
MENKIYLSDTDKKVGGVCGGLGEYFKVDAMQRYIADMLASTWAELAKLYEEQIHRWTLKGDFAMYCVDSTPSQITIVQIPKSLNRVHSF